MALEFRDFVGAVFRSLRIPVPYFDVDTPTSVLSFLRGTLEGDIHGSPDSNKRAVKRMFNHQLVTHKDVEGRDLSHLLITNLKPLLSTTATFQKSYDRHLLSICLLYTLRLKPRIPTADIEILLSIFADAASILQPRSASDSFWECTRMVTFATLQTFLPDDSSGGAAEDADETLLDSIAASAELIRYFQGTPTILDPVRLILQFTFILLQLRNNNRSEHRQLRERLHVCYRVGVLQVLEAIVSDRIFVQHFSQQDRLICMQITCRLLIMCFEVDWSAMSSPTHVLYRTTMADLKDGNSDGCDTFCTLLQVMSCVFEYCPEIIVQPSSELIITFITWLPESGLLEESYKVLTAYIRMISSLASGDDGARRIFNQLVEAARNQFSVSNPGFRYISWDFILSSMVNLCIIIARSQERHRLGVGDNELQGFASYLRLIGKIFRAGTEAQLRHRIDLFECEFKASLRAEKLHNIVLMIFCKPVPPELKAAACDALSGIGRLPEVAEDLLKNIKHVGLFAKADDTRRVHRHYLNNQLTTIEASIMNYTCTISTLRMINELLIHAPPVPNKETAMVEVTEFCREAMLPAIWKQLRFTNNGQLWELLAGAFEHFLVSVERLSIDTYYGTTASTDSSPGHIILHDVRSHGVIYESMRWCAQRYYTEQSSYSFASNSANSALVNLLDLILAILEAEGNFPSNGRLSFREIFLLDKDFVQKTLFSVDATMPVGIQIAATELMRQLYGKTPDKTSMLDFNVRATVFHGLGTIYGHCFQF